MMWNVIIISQPEAVQFCICGKNVGLLKVVSMSFVCVDHALVGISFSNVTNECWTVNSTSNQNSRPQKSIEKHLTSIISHGDWNPFPSECRHIHWCDWAMNTIFLSYMQREWTRQTDRERERQTCTWGAYLNVGAFLCWVWRQWLYYQITRIMQKDDSIRQFMSIYRLSNSISILFGSNGNSATVWRLWHWFQRNKCVLILEFRPTNREHLCTEKSIKFSINFNGMRLFAFKMPRSRNTIRMAFNVETWWLVNFQILYRSQKTEFSKWFNYTSICIPMVSFWFFKYAR